MYWQASDADAIGIYPVHTQWTVVDGVDRWDVGRMIGNWGRGTRRRFPQAFPLTPASAKVAMPL